MESPASPNGKTVRLQKWRQCLCVSTTARELFTTSLSLRDKPHWKFLFEGSGTPMEEDSQCPARVLNAMQLVSSSRQCTGSPGSCCTRIFSPKTSVCAQSSTLLPWFIPVIIFCSPNWSYHWKGASLKMFKTSKEMWHRVFGPYHKKTCRGRSSLC